MITFNEFLNEIAANPNFDLPQASFSPQRTSSKIVPTEDKFNIIPIRLGYDTYNVFNRYIDPRYMLVKKLLDRRGDSVDWVTVMASNQEIENLKTLADHIAKNAPDFMPGRPGYTNKEGEIRTALATLRAIDDSMAAKVEKED
jgi:hypothetical protein